MKPSLIAMIRPARFGYNEETAVNNFFQDHRQKPNELISEKALEQFDAMVALLRENEVDVIVFDDDENPHTPDAIFPNNWFYCGDGSLTLFPMCAVSRRAERNPRIIEEIKSKIKISKVSDLSFYEKQGLFLEGTGSMVIDRKNRIIYACISPRTSQKILEEFALENNFQAVAFRAADDEGREIYHTNVMMCIGDSFAVLCTEAIDPAQRQQVIQKLVDTGHEIIDISFSQMNSFAANMLEVVNNKNERLLILSKTAFTSLTSEQILPLEKHARLIIPEVSVIEKAGGGSVRCMMAELCF